MNRNPKLLFIPVALR